MGARVKGSRLDIADRFEQWRSGKISWIDLRCFVLAAVSDCKHPGCACTCGHQGLCPEDGPTAGKTDTAAT